MIARAAFGAALAGALIAATAAGAAAPYKPPRTAWGAPSLEGSWTNVSATHLERPPGLNSLIVSDAQAEAYDRRVAAASVTAQPGDDIGQAQSEWRDIGRLARIDGHARSSWLTSPADGKLPYRPQALAERRRQGAGVLDSPETLTASDRCLAAGWSAAGPPTLNGAYASNYQIFQRPDEVTIELEMLHEVRTIRIGGKPLAPGIRLWMGDSIGHWEGDTLKVETRNFHPQEGYRAPLYLLSKDAVVTEWFTRVSPTQIRYRFQVDDPAIYTASWSGEEPFVVNTAPVFEYACHEGNYSLPGILAGARREERLKSGR